MLTYLSPDGRHVETVRVALTERGLRATGYIVSASTRTYGATYSIMTAADGLSRRLTVRCSDTVGERSVAITRTPHGPWVQEGPAGTTPLPELVDCVDVYLYGSAFAASLPIRRLGWHRQPGEDTVTLASVRLPDLLVRPTQHSGRTVSISDGIAHIAYSGSFGDRELTVDEDGLLIQAEGVATRLG